MPKKQSLIVNEIFCSRQGEGLRTGILTTFIRLAGCNLSCEWCDTKYASSGKEENLFEIIKQVKKFSAKEVSITGGEPLTQKKGTIQLCKKLIKEGYYVSLETNGSIDWEGIPKKVMISMDIKPPSSGMTLFNNFSLLKKLGKNDQVKIVIKDKKDYAYSNEILNKYSPQKLTTVILQPMGGINAKELWDLAQKDMRFRIMLQLHKVVWGTKRGI